MRYRLKCGGKPRRKAFAGADGAIMAAATLAASAANVAAQGRSASTQAKAMEDNAKAQAKAIERQTSNNNQLQQEYIQFSKEQNKLLRDQQQEIQTTLQQLAGQENMNSRLDAGKIILRNGGIGNKRRLTNTFYGGASQPFRVTDGGGVLPIQVNNNGYGLYEIIGNDHEHYHKTKNGKNKTGVGIKFNDGSIVEGEGNQNSNQGELLYVTPQDAMFISKHSIKGFNPTEAVKQGMHPQQAFNIQQNIKNINGIADDGGKLPRRRSIAKYGILDELRDALFTRRGLARGIREFSQGNPLAPGMFDGIADMIEGNQGEPVYGIDSKGNKHFLGYKPNNDNENALFSIISGPASKMVKPIKLTQIPINRLRNENSKIAANYLNKLDYQFNSENPNLFSSELKGIPINLKTNKPINLSKLASIRFGIQKDLRGSSTGLADNIRILSRNMTTGLNDATTILRSNLYSPSIKNRAQKALDNIIQQVKNKQELRHNKKLWNEAAKEWQQVGTTADVYNRINPIINNTSRLSLNSAKSFISNNKKVIGYTGGALGTIGLGSYLGNKTVNWDSDAKHKPITIDNNAAHPYIDSYRQDQAQQAQQTRQPQQVQQTNINPIDSIKYDTIKTNNARQDSTNVRSVVQGKQATNVNTQKQINTTQAKQDAVNNNTTKVYKNFNEAFDAAIARGDKTFIFGGLEYAAKKAKGDDSRNRRWGARRTEQVMSKYKSWKDYLNRDDKRKMKCGGRIKAKDGNFWNTYGGSIYNGAGNIGGGLLSLVGGIIAGNKIGKSYKNASNILTNAYSQMHGINPSIIRKDDFNTGHAIAAIQSADTNVNPVLERIRRNASYESNNINRNTLSSAARQQRLAGINDRMLQRFSEAYANKHNQDQQITQANMQRIQEASNTNAQLDSQAMSNYNQLRAQIAMYNNDIENNKIAGIGQAQADALTNSATIRGNALQQGLTALGSGIASAAGGFANAWQANKEYKNNFNNAMLSAQPAGLVAYATYTNNRDMAENLYNDYVNSDNPVLQRYATSLNNKFGFNKNKRISLNNNSSNNSSNSVSIPWLKGNIRTIYGI